MIPLRTHQLKVFKIIIQMSSVFCFLCSFLVVSPLDNCLRSQSLIYWVTLAEILGRITFQGTEPNPLNLQDAFGFPKVLPGPISSTKRHFFVPLKTRGINIFMSRYTIEEKTLPNPLRISEVRLQMKESFGTSVLSYGKGNQL